MKKFVKKSLLIFLAAVMACLIFFPDRYIPIALEGIKLWALCVLPSLFPFFFFTLLFTSFTNADAINKLASPITAKLFRTGGISAYVFLMSILSGYPVGAKLICELSDKGVITKDEATRMSTLCSTSGPLFIIGTVGYGMFNSKKIGTTILLSHFMSAVICGIIFSRFGNFEKDKLLAPAQNKSENILYDCIFSSVISILCVGGFICIFYMLSAILYDFNLLYLPQKAIEYLLAFFGEKAAGKGFVYGLIECTNGCKILSLSPTPISVSLCCSLISFGGISIIMQSMIYLTKARIKKRIFVFSKILQMLLSFFLCLLAVKIFNVF